MLGCLTFLFSITLPFHYAILLRSDWFGERIVFYKTYYWSYKSSTLDGEHGRYSQFGESWFFDYWGNYYSHGSDLWLVFLSMFVVQVLTMITGIASIFTRRRVLALAPVLLCLTDTILMIYTNVRLQESNIGLNPLQQGYWLTYPSMFLFIIAFILTLVTTKKQTTS